MRNEKAVRVVLGNHDLYLISRALGVTGRKKRDTLDGVLDARDRGDMIDWLRIASARHRENGHLIVTPDSARVDGGRGGAARGRGRGRPAEQGRAEAAAGARRAGAAVERQSSGMERLVTIVQVLTRMRTCWKDGMPNLEFSGPPEAPAGCRAWFDVPGRERTSPSCSATGRRSACVVGDHAIGLDTGAVGQQADGDAGQGPRRLPGSGEVAQARRALGGAPRRRSRRRAPVRPGTSFGSACSTRTRPVARRGEDVLVPGRRDRRCRRRGTSEVAQRDHGLVDLLRVAHLREDHADLLLGHGDDEVRVIEQVAVPALQVARDRVGLEVDVDVAQDQTRVEQTRLPSRA